MDSGKLKKGARDLRGIVQEFGGLFIMLIVFALIIGVLVNQVTNGNVPTSSTANTSIQGLETSFDTQVITNAENASGTVTGLIILVVVVAIFAAFIYGRKSGKDNMLG